jgi:hypothetical protein
MKRLVLVLSLLFCEHMQGQNFQDGHKAALQGIGIQKLQGGPVKWIKGKFLKYRAKTAYDSLFKTLDLFLSGDPQVETTLQDVEHALKKSVAAHGDLAHLMQEASLAPGARLSTERLEQMNAQDHGAVLAQVSAINDLNEILGGPKPPSDETKEKLVGHIKTLHEKEVVLEKNHELMRQHNENFAEATLAKLKGRAVRLVAPEPVVER